MKKMFLLCMLALMSDGAIQGMEVPEKNPQPELSAFQNLPDDVKNLVILAFAQSGNDIDTAVKNIKIASLTNTALNQMLNEKYGNIKGFTALVHMLADKFNLLPFDVAFKFNTPIAARYVELYRALVEAVKFGKLAIVQQLIAAGADIAAGSSVLHFALQASTYLPPKPVAEVIALLLKNGADPYATSDGLTDKKTALDWLNSSSVFKNHPQYEQIKLLLENAMQK